MAARYLLNSSVSGNGKLCQHYQHQQQNVLHHCCDGYSHLEQPSANTHHTQFSITTMERDSGAGTICTHPPMPREGAAAVPVVMSLPSSSSPSANTHHTQLSSITTLEGDTIFPAVQGAAASVVMSSPPPSLSPSAAMPDQWRAHIYNKHHYQQMCQNGEKLEPIGYHDVLSSQPRCSPAAMANTAYTVEHSSTANDHQQWLCRHEPLYGCGCVNCVTFFSSPGHGYLSPLTHFNDEAIYPHNSGGHVNGEATPASYTYCNSFPHPPPPAAAALVRWFSSTFCE